MQDIVRVVVLNREGCSLNSVAKRLKTGRRTVRELVRKNAEIRDAQDVKERKRKKKTSPMEDQKIIQTSIKDRRMSSIEIARKMEEEIGLELNSRTIRSRLLSA